MKEIKVEWCENFIRALFKKYNCKGIYTKLVFNAAEDAGLYVKGTYGSSFSQALENLTNVKCAYDTNGNYAYSYFELKESGN